MMRSPVAGLTDAQGHAYIHELDRAIMEGSSSDIDNRIPLGVLAPDVWDAIDARQARTESTSPLGIAQRALDAVHNELTSYTRTTPLGNESLDDDHLRALGDRMQRDLLGAIPFVVMHPDTLRILPNERVEHPPLGSIDVRTQGIMPLGKYLLWDGHRLSMHHV